MGVRPAESSYEDNVCRCQVDVVNAERQTLSLKLEATDAPIYLPNYPLELVAGDDSYSGIERPSDPPAAGLLIAPGGPPLQLSLRADLERCKTGQHTMFLLLSPAGIGRSSIEFAFRQFEGGELRYSVSNRFKLAEMHFGEIYEPDHQHPWTVENFGGHTVVLKAVPAVSIVKGIPGIQWLRAAWRDGQSKPMDLPVGGKRALDVTIDLGDFNEQNFAGGSLAATISVSDDQHQPLSVVVEKVTLAPLAEHCLTIDFGNTNTYAAIRDGNDPKPLLDPNPEAFPSVIYFKKFNVENRNEPQIVIGQEAADLGLIHPDALVSGLKRRLGEFSSGPDLPILVWDAAGGMSEFKISELVRLFLDAVVHRAEKCLRQRVQRVALSFPVKFSDHIVERLRAIGADLASTYRRAGEPPGERPAFQVTVEVDEASAVAQDFFLDPVNQIAIRQRLADLCERSSGIATHPPSLVIGALDFGGGSVDTALAEIWISGSMEFGTIHCKHVYVGGDAEFGGDNITVAVQELLHQRIRSLLRAVPTTEWSFQDVRAKSRDSLSSASSEPFERENFRLLWRQAEQLKLTLCQPGFSGWKNLDSAEWEKTVATLNATVNDLCADVRQADGNLASRPVVELSISGEQLQPLQNPEFLMELDAVYDQDVKCDLRDRGNYNARQKIQECIRDMRDAALAKGKSIDFLVLAGASCRIPLVGQLVESILKKKHFPELEFILAERPKSRVGNGLVRYDFTFQMVGTRGIRLTPATQILRESIGVQGTWKFYVLIESCESVNAPENWHWFPDELFEHVLGDQRRIRLFRGSQSAKEHHPHGVFDLSKPGGISILGAETDRQLRTELPDVVPPKSRAAVRLCGSDHQIELQVEIGSELYGYWRMMPPDIP